MSLFTASGSIPAHQYVYIQPNAIGDHGWLQAVWFGLHSYPGRAWGCHVLLECGAIYRNVPLHHLATNKDAVSPWALQQSQIWDCYGRQFSTHVYDYLAPFRLTCRLGDKSQHVGRYLFTCVPVADAFTASPEQSKEFTFCALNNGRIVSLPTNHLLIEDKSFTRGVEWPTWLKRQSDIWASERND